MDDRKQLPRHYCGGRQSHWSASEIIAIPCDLPVPGARCTDPAENVHFIYLVDFTHYIANRPNIHV